jgi:hypothetical protein
MISLLLSLVVLGVIYWVCTLFVPQPFLKIILVVLVILAVVAVLSAFGVAGLPVLR